MSTFLPGQTPTVGVALSIEMEDLVDGNGEIPIGKTVEEWFISILAIVQTPLLVRIDQKTTGHESSAVMIDPFAPKTTGGLVVQTFEDLDRFHRGVPAWIEKYTLLPCFRYMVRWCQQNSTCMG